MKRDRRSIKERQEREKLVAVTRRISPLFA